MPLPRYPLIESLKRIPASLEATVRAIALIEDVRVVGPRFPLGKQVIEVPLDEIAGWSVWRGYWIIRPAQLPPAPSNPPTRASEEPSEESSPTRGRCSLRAARGRPAPGHNHRR